MKRCVLVTGGRDYDDRQRVNDTLDDLKVDFLIEGGASGADALARSWAEIRGVHFATVPALWSRFGKTAGPIRNAVMVTLIKALQSTGVECIVIAFPGGSGTSNCVSLAEEHELEIRRVGG